MIHLIVFLTFISCSKEDKTNEDQPSPAYKTTKNISYNGISVDVIIDKPEGNEFDVLITYHGTVQSDNNILPAAENVLNQFKSILEKDDMMLVSVAYPQEGLLFGDGILQCEAALLWVKNRAYEELQITIKNIFLAGHSQGGYMATRLNTKHATDGVIANAPGPINLEYRCGLEEDGQIPNGLVCNLLNDEYGQPSVNPAPYIERSLLNYTTGYKSDILFIQGLEDSPIQMHTWPTFKDILSDCDDCKGITFLELQGQGHGALFNSSQAKAEFNNFINK